MCSEFSAAHAITVAGQTEPIHGHEWHVTVVVGREQLDSDGLVIDFHELEQVLRDILSPLCHRTLNEVPPFTLVNPTAEAVAQFIGTELAARLPTGVELRTVRVTEAPGCAARFVPQRDAEQGSVRHHRAESEARA